MRFQLRKPTQALNRAYAKQSVSKGEFDRFQQALIRLFVRLDENETEDYQRTILADFFQEAFILPNNEARYALSAHNLGGLVLESATSQPEQFRPNVVLKAKKVFASEMLTTLKNNVKSLHELILYYFDELEQAPDTRFNTLIITDVYNWFVFSESDFREAFFHNLRLQKLYQLKRQQNKSDAFFYAETARILREMNEEVPVTCLNLREMAAIARTDDGENRQQLIPVYKLFSPEHLLNAPFANDGNSFPQAFYDELLYLLGLQETVEDNRVLLTRLPEAERQGGSLLENTTTALQATEALQKLPNLLAYGRDEDEQLFKISAELCLTWLGRLLFLKLLEARREDRREEPFLTPRHIREFNELNELFFDVLAVSAANRSASISTRYGAVPHVSGPLFRPTYLEQTVLQIGGLNAQLTLPLYAQTALQTPQGIRQTGQLATLPYLLAFLNRYAFETDRPAPIQPDDKPAMAITSLGLVLEKLSGYHTDARFVPGYAAQYMARRAVQQAVIERFNRQFAWQCADLASLRAQVSRVDTTEANGVINQIHVVDPAVGSGHLLVSALNELIALKSELSLLMDRDERPLSLYTVEVANDDLTSSSADGVLFDTREETTKARNGFRKGVSEAQRVQETLFREKQILIVNCLFGTDSSPVAVELCRLRLWIELLRSAPTVDMALPELDANIQAGNALVNRYPLSYAHTSIRTLMQREQFIRTVEQYRADVKTHKARIQINDQGDLSVRVAQFQAFLRQTALNTQKEYTDIQQLEQKRAAAIATFDFFQEPDHLQKIEEQIAIKKEAFARKQHPYEQAFEWRFAFPELLDDAGQFAGFDVVLSRPPANQLGPFVERGVSLLRDGGQLSLLLTHNFLTEPRFSKSRSLLLKQTRLFGTVLFADNASPKTVLMLAQKESASSEWIETEVSVMSFPDATNTQPHHEPEVRFVVPARLWHQQGAFSVDTNPDELKMLEDIERIGTPLGQFAELSNSTSVAMGDTVIWVSKRFGETLTGSYEAQATSTPPATIGIRLISQKAEIPTKALLAVLTSRLLGRYIQKKWSISGPVKLNQLRQLPIPNLLNDTTVQLERVMEELLANDPETAALREQADELVALLYGKTWPPVPSIDSTSLSA